MTDLDPICRNVLRAAYQISGFTESPVSFDQIANVSPISEEKFGEVIAALRMRGLVQVDESSRALALTQEGIALAATLPPVSEPPLFEDI